MPASAIGYGHANNTVPFNETDWTNLKGDDVQPYIKSKALAEHAAWDFIAREGGALELSVVNPVGIFGPALGVDFSSSIGVVKRMMDGGMPGAPKIHFGVVDVRDVADLHLRAMAHPAAKGERFLAVAGDSMSLYDVARLLRARMGAAARRVPRFQLPDWLVRLSARRDPSMRPVVPQLGKIRNASSEKARRLLGWAPRQNQDAILATAESLVRLGLLKSA
jgi:dihydroflavonol-4-reductase